MKTETTEPRALSFRLLEDAWEHASREVTVTLTVRPALTLVSRNTFEKYCSMLQPTMRYGREGVNALNAMFQGKALCAVDGIPDDIVCIVRQDQVIEKWDATPESQAIFAARVLADPDVEKITGIDPRM